MDDDAFEEAAESVRTHILAAIGDIQGLGARLTHGSMPPGLSLMLDSRALLEDELHWADAASRTARGPEVDVLGSYRLLVVKALVLAERNLATYPAEDHELAR